MLSILLIVICSIILALTIAFLIGFIHNLITTKHGNGVGVDYNELSRKSREGLAKIINENYKPEISVEEHFENANQALKDIENEFSYEEILNKEEQK